MSVDYLYLSEGLKPPEREGGAPFRAIIVADQSVNADWRAHVTGWLVRSGCLYALAWGMDCEAWHDDVDEALLVAFDFNDIPEDRNVMTTWHNDEPLSETFWFAGFCARHPTVELDQTLIVHIAPEERETEMRRAYAEAQQSEA
ncbi:MAG: hypothetical protein Q8J71_06445 [Brevundimonas sp.]|nr:hypothetical protein [Brevundimonas sp.]